ncbi:MAG: DNA repair protein RecO [Phycisphaerales bacterium]|jgi:DNA repair protein RecO (recombination protein O)|nr:DNA repair protein RecO [Phycisphaerales bacterium]
MTILSDTAICLRCWDYSETSQTVSLLTREYGIIRGLAKGSKRDTGAFSGGFDPATRGNVVARTKPNSDLALLTEWKLEQVWWQVRNDLQVNKAAIYAIDLVGRLITDHDPHTQVFDALCLTLDRVDDGHDIQWPLLQFQWALLVETGYKPILVNSECDGENILAFSSTTGGVVPDTGEVDRVRVRRETIDLLQMLSHDQTLQPVDPDSMLRANRLLAHYLRDLIGKETSAMRWMWN